MGVADMSSTTVQAGPPQWPRPPPDLATQPNGQMGFVSAAAEWCRRKPRAPAGWPPLESAWILPPCRSFAAGSRHGQLYRRATSVYFFLPGVAS